jgi:parvulin-like peptidyl-prolyl isomerase
MGKAFADQEVHGRHILFAVKEPTDDPRLKVCKDNAKDNASERGGADDEVRASMGESAEEAEMGVEAEAVDECAKAVAEVRAEAEAPVKVQAEKVLARALKGEDFAALAKQYGSDSTKDQGGDLGRFGHGAMVPEFEQAIFSVAPGQVGKELVKTQFGYHIVKVDDVRTARNFAKFMDEQLRSAVVKIKINVHNPFANLGATASPTANADNADTKK